MKKLLLMLSFWVVVIGQAAAQCAMCRSTLENNFSNGTPGIGAGINTGILYLLILPYLAVGVVAFLWFKSTKNAEKKLGRRPA